MKYEIPSIYYDILNSYDKIEIMQSIGCVNKTYEGDIIAGYTEGTTALKCSQGCERESIKHTIDVFIV